MTKKTILSILGIVIILALLVAIIPAWPGADKKELPKWQYLDDEYYSLIQIKGTSYLIRRIQDEYRQSKRQVSILSHNENDEIKAISSYTELYDDFIVFDSESGREIVPCDLDYPGHLFIIDDNLGVIIIDERGFYKLLPDGSISTLSPSTYKGKTYDMISEEFGINTPEPLFWNGDLRISPGGEYASYISNKNAINASWDVYVLNLLTGEEILLLDDSEYYYSGIEWLDNDNIICKSFHETDSRITTVNIHDKSISISLPDECSEILAAREGTVVAGNSDNSTLYILKFENNKLVTKHVVPMAESYRERPGIDIFNSDGSRIAMISIPDNNAEGRDLMIIDVATGQAEINNSVPGNDKTKEAVLEFYWINTEDLLVSIQNIETNDISSWIYRAGEQ